MEEGALAGGFGSAVLESLADASISVDILRIGIPDQLVDHATPQQSKESLGLTPVQMVNRIREHFELKTSLKLDDAQRVGVRPS